MIGDSVHTLMATYQKRNEYAIFTLKIKLPIDNEETLFSGPVDLDQITEWVGLLLDHQEDEFPFNIADNESLASAINRLYEELDPFVDEDSFEQLYNYRCIHDLSFGNRGVEMSSIILGKRHGQLTISKDCMNFNIKDFSCLRDCFLTI